MLRSAVRFGAMSSVAALPLMFGTQAHAADKVSIGGADWRDVAPPQVAQGPLGSGSFPGSLLVPGTETSLRIGGYIKLDAIDDFGKDPGDFILWGKIPTSADGIVGAAPGSPAAADTAANNRAGGVQIFARQSRFDVETRTPTALGDLRTYIEGDFFGNSPSDNNIVTQSATFALRHAYGELGPLLAGQTWSLAMDLDSAPETLDFGGPPGFVFIRQGSIRWTQQVGLVTLAGSLENPEGEFLGKGTVAAPTANNSTPDAANGGTSLTLSPNVSNKYPDVVTRATIRGPFGEMSWYALGRVVRADTGLVHASTLGYQTGLAGMLITTGKDNVRYEINYGEGGGRYINGFGGQAAAWNGANSIVTQTTYGGYVYYQHWWTNVLRSNVGAGVMRAFNETSIIGPITATATGQNPTRRVYGGHVNLIWSPVSNTNFGIEFSHGEREEESRAKGTLNRFQASAQFLF
jgi:hypothetical protein